MDVILQFLGYALLTFILELIVALVGFGRNKFVLLYCFLINMITNLITNVMVFLLTGLFGNYWIWVAIFEVLVLISESLLWRISLLSFMEKERVSWLRCIVVVFISNTVSFLAGLVI